MTKIIAKLTNTKEKKRLLTNFFSLTSLQAMTYVLPLFTLPYLVRVLGIEKYGLVQFAQSFIIFFNILVDYGFNLSATREIAVNRDNKNKVTEIFSSVLIIKITLLCFSFIVLVCTVLFFEKFSVNKGVFFAAFTLVVGQALFPIWYFQGMESMKHITISNIFSRLVFTFAIFIFIKKSEQYYLVPLFNGIGVCIGSIYALWLIKAQFKQKFTIPSFSIIKQHFIDSTYFFLSRVSVSLYTSANTFILGLFTNNTLVGYYAVANKLYQAIQGVFSPINQTLYPYIAKDRNVKLYKKILFTAIGINICGLSVAFLFGEQIFNLLFTSKLSVESLQVFKILLLANFVGVPSVLIGYPFLGALGYTKFTNHSVMIPSLFHICVLGVLMICNSISIYSIAIAYVTTSTLELLIRIYGVKKYKIWHLDKEEIK